MIDLTKYTRWIPPTKGEIFDLPIEVYRISGDPVLVHAFVPSIDWPTVTEKITIHNSVELYIPIPNPVARRLTRYELLDLMAMGGWVLKYDGGDMSSYYAYNKETMGIQIEDEIIGIRHAFTTEWLEPTTDLLPKEAK
jgi:hypothetical protein